MSAETLRAEPGLLRLLNSLDGSLCHRVGGERKATQREITQHEITQHRADALLARVAWSRIAEPGDGVAGLLAATIGVEAALVLLVEGASAERIQSAVAAASEDAATGLTSRVMSDALERWKPRLNRAETVLDIERAAAAGLRVLIPGDALWPVMVDDLGVHAPNMLWVRGNLEALSAYSLGVVGARAATGYGSHVTAELVDGACRAGLAIVSGAAYGIDAVAHRTALAAGAVTVAVVAGGADRPYPRAHESLLDRIAGGGATTSSGEDGFDESGGAVCSEMVPDSAPTRWRFLQRNRLIAALSRAILVPEAGMNSGSLNTAGHASQLGRPIGAVPGPVTSAASAGCHKLIRDYDAALITSVREVCELASIDEMFALFGAGEVGAAIKAGGAGAGAAAMTDAADAAGGADTLGRAEKEAPGREPRESAWARRVHDALPLRGSRDVDSIAKLAGLTSAQVRGVLSELELLGKVKRREASGVGDAGGTRWSLMKPSSG